MDRIHAVLSNWQNIVPFMLTTGGHGGVRVQRIIEALIIALIAGGLSTYATSQVLSVEIENIKTGMIKIERKVDKMHDDLYSPRQ